MIILNELPKDDPLRKTPLGQIDAHYRWNKAPESAAWRSVKVGAPKLVNFTFNQLGESWTNHDNWIVKNY